MFFLDSLMISGIRWTLKTVVSAAEAEMNDDGALKEQLLDAAHRLTSGEIGEDEYAAIEKDLLTRIREIKERREGGSGPLALGAITEADGDRIGVEATLQGDFHGPSIPARPEVEATSDPPRATPVKAVRRPARPETRSTPVRAASRPRHQRPPRRRPAGVPRKRS
jgi:hypothetical protein